MRYFNTKGRCQPKKHYMVRLDKRQDQIKQLYVDRENILLSTEADSMGKPQR